MVAQSRAFHQLRPDWSRRIRPETRPMSANLDHCANRSMMGAHAHSTDFRRLVMRW